MTLTAGSHEVRNPGGGVRVDGVRPGGLTMITVRRRATNLYATRYGNVRWKITDSKVGSSIDEV